MTKQIEGIQAQKKEYTGTFVLGATTPSIDLETEINDRFPTDHITPEKIEACRKQFIGDVTQTPPLFSAVKINGKRAYEIARKGGEAEIRSRTIHIYDFEITRIELPEVDFRVSCTKGTYIRSLARDFGEKLNSGAYLTNLRRTAIGEYRVEDALQPKDVTAD